MSALDIRQAKQSLAWWLREWGVTDEPDHKARQFVDDLVDRGWVMDARREDRPQPPKASEACRRCGLAQPCACTRDHLAAEPDPPAPPVGEVNPRLAQRLAGIGGGS